MKPRLCYCCRTTPLREGHRGACEACKRALRQIKEAHRLEASQDDYERTESDRREARLLARGRVGT